MTPLWLSLLQPLVELAATLWLYRRVNLRRYPAFGLYLLTEACWHLIAAASNADAAYRGYGSLLRAGHPFRMVLRAWVVFEVFQHARVDLDFRARAKAISAAVIACGVICLWTCTGVSPFGSFMLFRQYYQIVLAMALWALCLGAWPRMELVSQERWAHRYGVLASMTVLALSGTFVDRGLAYSVLPSDPSTWELATLLTYVSLTLTVSGMAYGMTRTAPKRKAAAKTADVWVRRKVVA